MSEIRTLLRSSFLEASSFQCHTSRLSLGVISTMVWPILTPSTASASIRAGAELATAPLLRDQLLPLVPDSDAAEDLPEPGGVHSGVKP